MASQAWHDMPLEALRAAVAATHDAMQRSAMQAVLQQRVADAARDTNPEEDAAPPVHARPGALRVLPAAFIGAVVPLPAVYIAKHVLPPLPPPAYYATVGTPTDGSCWYHSVAFLLNHKGYAATLTEAFVHGHTRATTGARPDADALSPRSRGATDALIADFRCGMADSFTRHEFDALAAQGFNPKHRPYDGVRAAFCKPHFWVDSQMIQHTANVLGLNLLIVDDAEAQWVCGLHGTASQRLGIVAWIRREHFQPVVRVDDPATGRLTTLFDTTRDAALVHAIVARYASTCSLPR